MWVGGIIFAVFVIGLLIGSEFLRKGQDTETDEAHADRLDYPSEGDDKAGIFQISRAIVAYAKDENSRYKENRSQNKRSHRIHFWTAVGVSAYTVLTLAILIINFVQYGEIHRFNKLQRAAMVAQIDLTKAQMRQLRADLAFTEGSISQSGNVFSTKISFKNTGPTPAYSVSYSLDIIIREEIPKAEVGRADPPPSVHYKETSAETADLGAGLILSYDRAKVASDAEVAAIIAGTKKVYVVAIVKYQDWQRLCQRDLLIGEREPDNRVRIVVESGSTSNYTGDPCEGDPPKSTFPKPWDAPRP